MVHGAEPGLTQQMAHADIAQFRDLLAHYHALCRQVGPLPPPRALNIDHRRQRFLLFAFYGPMRAGA